jgi:Cu2+-exporting ATPase
MSLNNAERAIPAEEACFHCGEPVPPGVSLTVEIDGTARKMCCHGCLAVAEAIRGYGLEKYYRYRTGVSNRPEEAPDEGVSTLQLYDDPAIQEGFAETLADGQRSASLVLDNVVCPACSWLIETQLAKLAGVTAVSVNYSTHHARVQWDPSSVALSRILREIAVLGYKAWPYQPGQGGRRMEIERKEQLRRIALAGLLGMQVMMLAIVLYTGDWSGDAVRYRRFFQWTSLLLTLPVVAYSAAPFFRRAWRDLRLLQPGMDVPVALGIGIAFLGGCRATLTGTGDVYFDSVVMFVFLLSLGRYLEFMARKKSVEHIESLGRVIPAFTTRLSLADGGCREEAVAVVRLQAGDRVLVRPGETIPADGHILQGASTVDESVLTGESLPAKKEAGSPVFGGSRNIESPLQVQVEKLHRDSLIARIHALLEQGRLERPAFVALTNRIASRFVLFVLFSASFTAAYWFRIDTSAWIPVTVSVLIVTCPCALSLAMPTAFASAITALMKQGVAVVNPDVTERLAKATHFVFDKTGTLTEGRLQLTDVKTLAETGRDDCLNIAASLESGSEHPLAAAVLTAAGNATRGASADIRNYPGEGITGMVEGRRYYLGSEGFVAKHTGHELASLLQQEAGSKAVVVLADDERPLALFYFSDAIRTGARDLIQSLHADGRETVVLSGDSRAMVDYITRKLGIHEGWSRQMPQDKLRRIAALQDNGASVVMIGDGVNDAPVLAAANASIAMGSGTELSRANADIILLANSMETLLALVRHSRRTMRVIHQNFAWALCYNLLALPAAVAGLVQPWMAALGMSLSSLLVVLNSARLAEIRRRECL